MSDAPPTCRRGRWCPDRLSPTEGSPYPGPGGLCSMCASQARAAVHALAGRDLSDLADLQLDPVALDRVERDPSLPGSTYRERQVPLDLYGDALARLIVHELCVWACASDRSWPYGWPPTPGRQDRIARRAAASITAQWDLLLSRGVISYSTHEGVRPADGWYSWDSGNPLDGKVPQVVRDGGGAALGFLDLHHRVERACGHGGAPPVRHPQPCPGCGHTDVLLERTAREHGDQTTVTCTACAWSTDGAAWFAHLHPTVDHGQELDRSWVDDLAGRLNPATRPAALPEGQ